MCGITGMIGFGQTVEPDTVQQMLNRLAHRGPDDEGLYLSPDGSCALAHARLSVVDLSPAARQPMCNEDGSVWIACNGEIYNSPELRRSLEQRRHRFRSRSDTEVILHLYEEVGTDVPGHLDGMFAFALYDRSRARLLLGRDPMGKKPLYLAYCGRSLLFASEPGALLAHPDVRADLDLEGLGQYLAFRTTAAPLTLLRGIRKVAAGSTVTVHKDGSTDTATYWQPFAGIDRKFGHYRDAVAEVRTATQRAVQKRLLADVPIACFLSGGLDSSIIVALMAEQSREPIDTFTVRWRDFEQYNEDHHAEAVARRYATQHHVVALDQRTALQYLESDEFVLDEPLADSVSLPLHFLSKAVRAAGRKVAMAGEGSDELFFGYDSRRQAIHGFLHGWRYLLALPLPLRQLLDRLAANPAISGRIDARNRMRIGKAARDEEVFLGGSTTFAEGEFEKLLRAAGAAPCATQSLLKRFANDVPTDGLTESFARKIVNIDLRLRLPELLLARLDRMSMRHGVEVRAPFMDQKLVESAVWIPYRYKLDSQGGKRVLKDAFADLLPASILARPKQPFGVPMVEWMRTDLYPHCEAAILNSSLKRRELFDYTYVRQLLEEHRTGRANHVVQLWILYVLSRWYDRWIDGPRGNC